MGHFDKRAEQYAQNNITNFNLPLPINGIGLRFRRFAIFKKKPPLLEAFFYPLLTKSGPEN